MCSCFEIKLCKLIDISKHSKCENLDFKTKHRPGLIRTRDLSHTRRESYLYTMIVCLLHRLLAFIDMKVSQVQPTLS